MIGELLKHLNDLEASIKKIKTININRDSIKQLTIETGSFYFKRIRSEFVKYTGEVDTIRDYDDNWQQLIRLAHGNNLKSSYLKVIKILKKFSREFSISTFSQGLTQKENPYAETLLVRTLQEIVPSAAQSYRQAMEDLSQNNKISYRGTACEFREALRDILNHLAPDNEIMKPGFKLEKDQTKPTMKQKVQFILKSRNRGEKARNIVGKSIDIIENLFADITRAFYDRASVSTHVQTTKKEIIQLKRYLDVILFDLLEITEPESI